MDGDVRDRLAMERTTLANERTLLSYVRTALAFAGGGLGLIHFFDSPGTTLAGWVLAAFGGALGILGAIRFNRVKQRLRAGQK